MNRALLSFVVPMLTLGAIAVAAAQTGTTTAPGGAARGLIIADHVHGQAQVTAIDYAKRSVTLKGADGQSVTLTVGPQARNFDKVKVGDQVKADYYRSTAVFLRKSDQPPAASATQVVQVAGPGEQPGGLMVRTREISARVDAVDQQQRLVTLTGPRGNRAILKVEDTVPDLAQIKQGDQVVVRYTEALAVAVDKKE